MGLVSSVLVGAVTFATPTVAAGNFSEFNGTYEMTTAQTITTTYLSSNVPPQVATNELKWTLLVKDGILTGTNRDVTGAITSSDGSAWYRMPFGGIVSPVTGVMRFARDTAGHMTVTGQGQSTTDLGVGVISNAQVQNGTSTDDIIFTVESPLAKTAVRGKAFSYSFCRPAVGKGRLCGGPLSAKIVTNPTGGPTSAAGAPSNYKFATKSGFLPRGLVLNARTGAISGTPYAGDRPGMYKFMVCAYTGIANRWDACKWTSLKLR